MDPQLIASFVLATVLMALMPGPDILYVMTESISRGQRTGISIAAGLCTGCIVHTTAAALGLSIVLQRSETAFAIIQYAGVAYLLYLAYQATREKPLSVEGADGNGPALRGFWALFRRGITMNLLNPKVSLFFIAFLPQFITEGGMHYAAQMILLGFIFMSLSFLIFCSMAYLAGKLTSLMNKPGFWTITKWSKVVVLTGMAVLLMLGNW